MSDGCLVVLTGKSRDTILRDGGTSSWVLVPKAVRRMKYAICTRHAHSPHDLGVGNPGPEAHGTAFLVGRIADVQLRYTENGRNRYIVTFDAYAEVDVPEFWDGSRNPVRYMSMKDVEARGLDLWSLDLKPMPARSAPPLPEADSAVAPLSIIAAKRGLAANFGIPEEAIEIIIKG